MLDDVYTFFIWMKSTLRT